MLTLHEPSRHGLGRREWLRIGGLNALGLSLASPCLAGAGERDDALGSTFGRARNVIFLYLAGGAPQHETFDPKPEGPAEVRGEFAPIHTNVPGIDFCELLPRTATIADRLAVCRAMATDDNTHSTSGYWVLTGRKYAGANARDLSSTDWPNLGSVVKRLRPSDGVPFGFAWLPEPIVANPGVLISGQSAGWLGRRWDPDRFTCDPQDEDFAVREFELPGDVAPLRLDRRMSLLEQVEGHARRLDRDAAVREYDRLRGEALGVLTSGRARRAFAIDEESTATRDRFGRGKWGQSVLLARRLIEAGVRFVHVQWPREPGDLASSAPTWDTHANNNARVKDVLCPQFDVGFSALVEDLEDRGLLDETLVVATGEFGRTPRFNGNGGRDHWGHVFSLALAGAGISGARVIGSSDASGAHPTSGRILPGDLAATILHLLGIGHEATVPDPGGRPVRICEGEPLDQLLGDTPATTSRREPTGNVAPIPDFRPIHAKKS